MSNDVSARILAKLKAASETGSLGDLAIELWDRGGPPGKGFESDLLQVLAGGEKLTHTRFDPAYAPPFRVEEYTGPADPAVVRELAGLAVTALEGTYTEELPVPVGGVTKISLRAYETAGSEEPAPEVAKTFFEHLPKELGALGELVKARMAELMKRPATIVSKPVGAPSP